MTDAFPHLFTLREANGLLDTLRPLVARMLEVRNRIVAIQPDLEDVLKKVEGNGGSGSTGALLELLSQLKAILAEVQRYDVLVKDVNTGLLDFPAEREGRIVFLCWQYDEAKIEYWHDLNAGFAGRQPI